VITLPNSCYCSDLSVFPKNWNTKKASIKKDWYISYRFYDPTQKAKFPKGKLVISKAGINLFKDLEQRQSLVKIAKDEILHNLQIFGYNPMLKICIPPPDVEPIEAEHFEIDPSTPICDALEKAFQRLKDYEPQSLSDIKSVLKYITISAKELRLETLPIKDVNRKVMRQIVDNCNKSNDRKNKYLNWLSVLFEELIYIETIEYNPVEKIRKEKVVRQIRATINKDDRKTLDENLKNDNYNLWRFMHIFFHSGARQTELVGMKVSDVSLHKQEFKVLIKKGGQWVYKVKVIKDVALPFWAELLSAAKKDDYVFSTYLSPGQTKIHADRINKLWKKYVKDPYGITEDFYSLKHSHTTEVVQLLSNKAAAEHNSHTSTRMVDTVYDVDFNKRADATVKHLQNKFV